jgi:hypothetical protein
VAAPGGSLMQQDKTNTQGEQDCHVEELRSILAGFFGDVARAATSAELAISAGIAANELRGLDREAA